MLLNDLFEVPFGFLGQLHGLRLGLGCGYLGEVAFESVDLVLVL